MWIKLWEGETEPVPAFKKKKKSIQEFVYLEPQL